MQQSVRALDQQHLDLTAVNLRKLKAEIEQLRDLIRAAEAKTELQDKQVANGLAGQVSPP